MKIRQVGTDVVPCGLTDTKKLRFDFFFAIFRTQKLLIMSRKMTFNLLNPTGHVIHQQCNIQQLYVLPHTLYLCVLYLSENKQRLVSLTA
jgi:hypothetical protein